MPTQWKRSLGTSKREQGISTPKAPQNQKRIFFIEKCTKSMWNKIKDICFNMFSFMKKDSISKDDKKQSFKKVKAVKGYDRSMFIPKVTHTRTGNR